MYIAEISPPAWRGRMVSFNQLFIVLGSAGSRSSATTLVRLDARFGGDARLGSNWRWMLGIGVVPAIPYFFALLFVPESPRWLAMHGRLPRHGGFCAPHGAASGPTPSSRPCSSRSSTKRGDAKPVLARNPESRAAPCARHRPARRRPAADHRHQLRVVVRGGDLRARRARGANASFMQTVLVGLVNVVFTVLALLLIDRVGRRPLLMFGCVGIGAFMLLASYGFTCRRRSAKLTAGADRRARLRRRASRSRWGRACGCCSRKSFPTGSAGLAISCVGCRQLRRLRDRAVRVSVGDGRRWAVRALSSSTGCSRCAGSPSSGGWCRRLAAAASKSSKKRWFAGS